MYVKPNKPRGIVPEHSEGVAVVFVRLDPRITIYSMIGDLFAWVCLSVTLLSFITTVRFGRGDENGVAAK